jgi:hypothetical protein
MTGPKHDIKRIRVDRDGYDPSGAYWGAGPDVYSATSEDGRDEITVRARGVNEAREKIAAELTRAPGAAPAEREILGGNARRKTRYEITWSNPLNNESITIRITHARDYLSSGSDHIEVESIRPKKAPLPITETGYRSHFIAPLELINAGGPATFVRRWIEQEASGKAWTKAAKVRSQGDLFQWAETNTEIAKRPVRPRNRSARPKGPAKPVAKAAKKRRNPSRDPA